MPPAMSPAIISVIPGPLNDVKVPVPPVADVLSIEILVPPLAGVTVAAANAGELKIKKPLTTKVAVVNKTTDLDIELFITLTKNL